MPTLHVRCSPESQIRVETEARLIYYKSCVTLDIVRVIEIIVPIKKHFFSMKMSLLAKSTFILYI